jgi:hypothetical protein
MLRPFLICAVLSSLGGATPAKTTSFVSSSSIPTPTPTICPVPSNTEVFVGFPTSVGAAGLPFSTILASSTDLYTGPPWGTGEAKYIQPTACADTGSTLSFVRSWKLGEVVNMHSTRFFASYTAHSEAPDQTWDYTCTNRGGHSFMCEETSTSGSFISSSTYPGEASRETLTIVRLGEKLPASTTSKPGASVTSGGNAAQTTGSKPTNTPGVGARLTTDMSLLGAAFGAAVAVLNAILF